MNFTVILLSVDEVDFVSPCKACRTTLYHVDRPKRWYNSYASLGMSQPSPVLLVSSSTLQHVLALTTFIE